MIQRHGRIWAWEIIDSLKHSFKKYVYEGNFVIWDQTLCHIVSFHSKKDAWQGHSVSSHLFISYLELLLLIKTKIQSTVSTQSIQTTQLLLNNKKVALKLFKL